MNTKLIRFLTFRLPFILFTLVVLYSGYRFYFLEEYLTDPVYLSEAHTTALVNDATVGITSQTRNVYFIGDSTLFGSKWGPQISPSTLTAELLGPRIEGVGLSTINLAVSGTSASQVKQIALEVIRNKERFHPNLLVLMTGHNEFARFIDVDLSVKGRLKNGLNSLTGQEPHYVLGLEQRQLIDEPLFKEQVFEKIYTLYERHLTEIAESASKAGVPILFVTSIPNYADWEPNRSTFNCHDETKLPLLQALAIGDKAFKEGRLSTAEANYNLAVRLCNTFAEAHFKLGKANEELGKHEEAWKNYQAAIDLDKLPVRVTSRQNRFLLSLTKFPGVHVLDAVSEFKTVLSGKSIGKDIMADAHHPNLRGYAVLSEAIATNVFKILTGKNALVFSTSLEGLLAKFPLTQKQARDIEISFGRWFTKAATWRYSPEERLFKAEAHFKKALQFDPKEYRVHLGLALIHALQGKAPLATEELNLATQLNKDETEAYLKNSWVRAALRF